MKKRLRILTAALFVTSVLFTGCSKEEDTVYVDSDNEENRIEPNVLTAPAFTVTISENPTLGQVLGQLQATGEGGSVMYSNSPFVAANGVAVSSTGQLTVSDVSFFDFEINTVITTKAQVTIDGQGSTETQLDITINITDVVELNVQQRLAGGETPSQIYNSDNTLLDSLYGKTYVGGFIFYFDNTDGSGLVSAPNDQSISLVWDPNSTGLVATTATSTAIGDGAQNTFIIATSIGAGSYAARLCSDLVLFSYTGWFMPTLDELEQMYGKLHANGIGNFQNAKYWSSSELDANGAWYRDFSVSSGQTAATGTKTIPYAVRAIRAF